MGSFTLRSRLQSCSTTVNVERCFQTSFPLQASLLSFSPIFRYIHPSLCICVCVRVCTCVCSGGGDDGRVWSPDSVVPFLRPIVLHQARRDVISLSQAQPLYNASLPECVYVCVCVCVYFHPANNASLHVSPRALLAFLPVSLPSESRVICSRHIYRTDLCLLRCTRTLTHIHTHTHTHTHRCRVLPWHRPDNSAQNE